MYTHNLNPVLLHLGSLEIRYYGLVYLLGFFLVYFALRKKQEFLGLDDEKVDYLMLYALIGLIIGARIFTFLFEDPSVFIKDPLELFKIWHGGMSFFGALTGIIIGVYLATKKFKTSFLKAADVIVIPITIALILGRLANFVNGELVGTVTTLPWCVVFPTIDNLCRHPYQIYASLSHVLLLGILLSVKRIKNLKPGLVFYSFVVFYCIIRFITDFVRQEIRYFGLSVWQYVCLVTILLAVGMFLRKRKIK